LDHLHLAAILSLLMDSPEKLPGLQDLEACFETSAGALRLRVRAQPRSSREGILGVHGGRVKIAVHEAPENNQANEAIAGLLRRIFGLRAAQVQLLSGGRSREKCFALEGLALQEALQALAGRLQQSRKRS
jgi:hypothetical protein